MPPWWMRRRPARVLAPIGLGLVRLPGSSTSTSPRRHYRDRFCPRNAQRGIVRSAHDPLVLSPPSMTRPHARQTVKVHVIHVGTCSRTYVPYAIVTFCKTEKRTHDYTRHGTTNLFAALDTATDEVVGRCFARRRTEEFLKFMDQVVAAQDGQENHVVLDNLSTHSGSDIDQWLTKHPNVTFHFTPAGSSWLNQVEIWFGIITRQAIRRGTFRSLRQLINTINTYIAKWNHDSKPFT